MSDCNQRNYRNMHSMTNHMGRMGCSSYNVCGDNNQRSRITRECIHCHHKMDDDMNAFPLAMGYIPWQRWCNIHEQEKILCQGTIFKDLDKPFYGCRGGKGR